MQPPSKPQQRILSLIDGYPAIFGGDGESDPAGTHLKWVRKIMRQYPGHWFLVGEIDTHRGQTGTRPIILQRHGFETERMNCKVYARVPHPDGRPLTDLVEYKKPWGRADALPELADNKFGWSRDELSNALATARAWLFPDSERVTSDHSYAV